MLSIVKTSQLMLYRQIAAVCSDIHMDHINMLYVKVQGSLMLELVAHIFTAEF
jgi:hypothetical protein